jgi:hypothetical protein
MENEEGRFEVLRRETKSLRYATVMANGELFDNYLIGTGDVHWNNPYSYKKLKILLVINDL